MEGGGSRLFIVVFYGGLFSGKLLQAGDDTKIVLSNYNDETVMLTHKKKDKETNFISPVTILKPTN